MNKILITCLLAFVVGCGTEEIEEFVEYTPEQPSCWTVDGDPELYFHIIDEHEIDNEFHTGCEKLHQESLKR